MYASTLNLDLSVMDDPCLGTYAGKAKEFYFGESLDKNDIGAYVQLVGDSSLGLGSDTTARMMTALASAPPLYRYVHSFSDNTTYSLGPKTDYGTNHGDELFYIFNLTGVLHCST